MNSRLPSTTVTTSASSGEAMLQKRETSGRCSSLNIRILLALLPLGENGGGGGALPQRMHHPQPAHPLADQRHRGTRAVDAGRQPPFRDHVQAVADLEQFVQF